MLAPLWQCKFDPGILFLHCHDSWFVALVCLGDAYGNDTLTETSLDLSVLNLMSSSQFTTETMS